MCTVALSIIPLHKTFFFNNNYFYSKCFSEGLCFVVWPRVDYKMKTLSFLCLSASDNNYWVFGLGLQSWVLGLCLVDTLKPTIIQLLKCQKYTILMFSLKLLLFLVYFQWNTLKRLYTWQVIHCDYTRDQICIMFLLLITMVQWHIINTKFTAIRFQKQENLSGWIKESFFYSWQIISSFLDTHLVIYNG